MIITSDTSLLSHSIFYNFFLESFFIVDIYMLITAVRVVIFYCSQSVNQKIF